MLAGSLQALRKSARLQGRGRESEAAALLKPYFPLRYSFYGQLALEELGERMRHRRRLQDPATSGVTRPDRAPRLGSTAWIPYRRVMSDLLVRNLAERQLLDAASARRHQLRPCAQSAAERKPHDLRCATHAFRRCCKCALRR